MPEKLKFKKHADKILTALCFYENYLIHNPDDEGLFTITLGEKTEDQTPGLESVKNLKTFLETIVEIPYMKFSKPVSKEKYLRDSATNLKLIENNYLKVKETEIAESDKEVVLKIIKEFYLSNEYKLLFGFSSYDATPDDRIAHHVFIIGIGLAFLPLFQLISSLLNNIEFTDQNKEKIDFDSLFDEYISEPELNDPQMSKKKIVTGTIIKIYDEIGSKLTMLTDYQKQTVTGYIAVRFGLIDFNDRPQPGSYTSDNNYLAERVRTIVNRAPVQK